MNKQKRMIAIGAVVLVAVAGGVVLFANSSNTAQIVETPSTKRVAAPAFKSFDGQYMTFQYAGKYGIQKQPASDMDLEITNFTADTNYDKRLAVTVSKLNGGLTNNSAYNLRAAQTSIYASHQATVDGSPATVWVKNDKLEETVFVTHGDNVAVLSFTTTGNADNLDPEVSALLTSFKWK